MPRTMEHTAKQVIAAIKGTGGVKQAIADRLGVHRHTVDRYLASYKDAQQAFLDESEAVGDYAEGLIVWQLHEKEKTGESGSNGKPIMQPTARAVEMARWFAARKLRNRGYGDRQDIDLTTGGEKLPPTVVRIIVHDK